VGPGGKPQKISPRRGAFKYIGPLKKTGKKGKPFEAGVHPKEPFFLRPINSGEGRKNGTQGPIFKKELEKRF